MNDRFDYLPPDMGSPYLERKNRSLRWSDGTLTCYHEFDAALDQEALRHELKAIWRMWRPRLGRKTEMLYGKHGGFYSAPKEALDLAEEVVGFYFDTALKRLLKINPKARKSWHEAEDIYLQAKADREMAHKKLITTRPLLLGATTQIRAMNVGFGYVVAWTDRDGLTHQELFKKPDRRMFKRMLDGGWLGWTGLGWHPNLHAVIARFVAMHPPVQRPERHFTPLLGTTPS